jgi:hypothetical protein
MVEPDSTNGGGRMSGWKPVPWDGVSTSKEALEREFRDQGELVSLCREPPQNTTDNPCIDFDVEGAVPVKLRYTLKNITNVESLKEIFPQTEFVKHVTNPDVEGIVNFYDEYDTDSFQELIEDQGMDVLLVEDYQTTGLVGQTSVPAMAEINNHNNTFFWFMRSQGATREEGGRGGSWGLGKFAFPIASSIRTFFCVTSRYDSNDRLLAGQAFLNDRSIHGQEYGPMMYYAKDELEIEERPHSWLPIDATEEIDAFCQLFGVDREEGCHGTSMVIPLPKKELSMKKLALGLVTNWIVPILDGKLELEFVQESTDTKFTIHKGNAKSLLTGNELPEEVWSANNKRIDNKINPAWISKPRITELISLHEGLDSVVDLELDSPSPDSAPNSQWNSIFPERDSVEMEAIVQSFNAGNRIHIKGSLPVNWKTGPLEYGEYELVFRKCEDGDAAEAHFYRDQISIPGVNDRAPLVEGVSSLMMVSGGSSNPLSEMLRQSEGPAHLNWRRNAKRMTSQYEYGSTTIGFLKDIVKKLVHHISSSQVESQSIWTHIFSLGPDKTDVPPPIVRDFNILEAPLGGSCTVEPSNDAEHMTGRVYIARIGYPKPANQNPKKAPDARNINVHDMDWVATGATITTDVTASNGDLCVDRVRVHITAEDFNIQVDGLAVNKRAQIILHQEVEQ